MAPEVAMGKRADRRADLYQVGLLLFFNLTGTSPYTPEEMFRVMSGGSLGQVDLAGRLSGRAPQALIDYVLQAIKPDPEARFQSAKQMLEELPVVPRA
jgi:serine/threonine-protein kinase